MLISRAPLRISFCGGGSDFEDYYKISGGAVISTTIDKHIYATINHKFDDKIHLRYSEFECVDNINLINHKIIREALRMAGIHKAVEIVTISDIPTTGSGLGSSSCLATALFKAFYSYKGYPTSPQFLAEMSCKLEIELLGSPIGKQDQYASSHGGLNLIKFKPNGEVEVENLYLSGQLDRIRWLEDSTMLFYTGSGRHSNDILSVHKKSINEKIEILNEQKALVDTFYEWISGEYKDNAIVGDLINLSWKYKKQMTPETSNSWIDGIISSVLSSGAYGAKLCGAGGSGFMLVICDRSKQHRVRETLSGFKELEFKFEENGAEDIYAD